MAPHRGGARSACNSGIDRYINILPVSVRDKAKGVSRVTLQAGSDCRLWVTIGVNPSDEGRPLEGPVPRATAIDVSCPTGG